MAAYVSGYRHDIFVSYARVDDEKLPGAQEGWVKTLVAGLKVRLGQKLGRSDLFSLWQDEQSLSQHKNYATEILDALRASATLVIILSPGYKASYWCMKEMETFWNELQQRADSESRIFVVQRDKLESKEKPESLRRLLGYQFWIQDREGKAPRILGDPIPDPQDRLYYDKLGDLANDIATELKRLQALEEKPGEALSANDTRPAVYLAEVTDDLDTQRDQVARHLSQEGFRVIPNETSHYFSYLGGTERVAEALAKDLQNCKLFVQILSRLTGKCRPGQPSFPGLQYRAALDTGIPVLQWRDPGLDLATVESADHRALLEGETVLATGLEEFKHECVIRLKAQVSKPKPVMSPNLVFLNASSEDADLGDSIAAALGKQEIGYALPTRANDPKLIQEDLELSLSECDGLIIVYGPTTHSWARAQILRSRRIIGLRDRPLKALAVYEGPPEDKPSLGVELPGMLTLNCRRGLEHSALQRFLAALHTD
ncbi:MAG: toll/interleukin-1 receptor domain-containing protein [Gammaproteobacteria bacterium]